MGWRTKKKKKKEPKSEQILPRGAMLLEDLIECCDGKSNPIKFFSVDEILKATNNFSDSNHVSQLSNLGREWYSNNNENRHKMLIKKADNPFFNSYREGKFCRDIAVSSMVSGHKNFLKLVGYCLEFEDPVKVYHGVKKHYKLNDLSEQSWKRRMKIAEDIATALAYLHTAFPRPFVYRNLFLENIILDEDGVAKLSDFSYCVSIPKGETFVRVDKVMTLYSCVDCTYLRGGMVSEKTDVLSIGILMQRLLMGRERVWKIWLEYGEEEEADGEGDADGSYDSETRSETNVPSWLLKFKEERRMDEIADPEMLEKMGEISEEELCQMKAFRMLSLRCIDHNGELVPTMVEVANELKKIQRSL